MILFLIRNIKTVSIVFLVAFLIGTAFFIYHKGYSTCEMETANKAYKDAINIKERQDEIRNNRPDDAALIRRLRDGTF